MQCKGGDKADVNNYWPISKLTCLAKVLESLVNNQLESLLSVDTVLSPELSGFRAKHSSVTAITSVTNDVISAADEGKYCAALFVDLTKAFETVYHALLIQSLSDVGFDFTSWNWFKDYVIEHNVWL